MRDFTFPLVVVSTLLAGCGSTGSTSDAGADSSVAASDAGTDTGTPADTGTNDTGAPSDTGTLNDTGAPSDAGTSVKLTVQNYLAWCSVSVQGGSASTNATQTVNVPAGTVVNLTGDKANATFVWGYWFGTAGDTSAAHDTKKATTVTVTKDTVVQACCPFANAPNTPCPPPTP